MSDRRAFLGLPALGVIMSAFSAHAMAGEPRRLLVFAPASLREALDEAAHAWRRHAGKPAPRIAYAGTSVLARQIALGAPADIFISADPVWMDFLAAKSLIKPATRRNLLGNRLVLIAPAGSKDAVRLEAGSDLHAVLGEARLAMANTDAVPAGKYGKAALEKLGLWHGVRNRVAQADNVRGALVLVSRGEAKLGVVYATDAAIDASVRIVAQFPPETHPPIVYPGAMIQGSTNNDAMAFLGFLAGAEAGGIFRRFGFSVVGQP